MRTKRFFAFLMMCCLAFSLAACGNQKNATQELGGIFPAIAGEKGTTYQSLFDVILAEQYNDYWTEKCASIVGDEAAEASAAALKAYISCDIYGQEAIDTYAQSGGMGFDCWYINNAKTFEFKGNQVTTTLTDGTSSTHTYEYLGVYKVGEGETMEYGGQTIDPSFECDVYKSTDDAGEFTYFFLRDDTMEETYHIEFRYSPKWIDGKKHARNIYAHTREECEEKLAALIIQMKRELAELKAAQAAGMSSRH